MRLLDRREVLKLGTASALVAVAPPWPDPALAGTRVLALVLADGRYRDSRLFAHGAERGGAEIVPFARNLGDIWFNTVAPRLPGLQALAGLTLDSDFFILRRLAEGSGAKTAYAGRHDWRQGSASAHDLGGVLPLEPLSAALRYGEDRWAGRLGAALMQAASSGIERNGKTRKAAFQLARPPVADSPGYFVSWLLTWPAGAPTIG